MSKIELIIFSIRHLPHAKEQRNRPKKPSFLSQLQHFCLTLPSFESRILKLKNFLVKYFCFLSLEFQIFLFICIPPGRNQCRPCILYSPDFHIFPVSIHLASQCYGTINKCNPCPSVHFLSIVHWSKSKLLCMFFAYLPICRVRQVDAPNFWDLIPGDLRWS